MGGGAAALLGVVTLVLLAAGFMKGLAGAAGDPADAEGEVVGR